MTCNHKTMDWDLYHHAVSLYKRLENGELSIFIVNGHKYVKVRVDNNKNITTPNQETQETSP